MQKVLARLDPLKPMHHERLAAWFAAQNEHAAALAELRVVLALEPHDRAAAHYRIANTLHQLERTEEARHELLKALEIAPRYSPALALLLEINQ